MLGQIFGRCFPGFGSCAFLPSLPIFRNCFWSLVCRIFWSTFHFPCFLFHISSTKVSTFLKPCVLHPSFRCIFSSVLLVLLAKTFRIASILPLLTFHFFPAPDPFVSFTHRAATSITVVTFSPTVVDCSFITVIETSISCGLCCWTFHSFLHCSCANFGSDHWHSNIILIVTVFGISTNFFVL